MRLIVDIIAFIVLVVSDMVLALFGRSKMDRFLKSRR